MWSMCESIENKDEQIDSYFSPRHLSSYSVHLCIYLYTSEIFTETKYVQDIIPLLITQISLLNNEILDIFAEGQLISVFIYM